MSASATSDRNPSEEQSADDANRVVRLASELIAIPSVSRDSNVPVSQRCFDELIALGFDVERIPLGGSVPKESLVGFRPGERDAGGQESGFAYFGHTDVVPADDWTGPGSPFSPTVQNGRLYGRGACDMKGSVAAMLTAAIRPTSGPVWVVLTADEEVGFGGARSVVESSKHFEDLKRRNPVAIIGEPTGGTVLHGHKGGVVWSLVATGSQGHSSFGVGESATRRLLPALQTVSEVVETLRSDPKFSDRRFDPPGPTPNVRIVDSSPAVNVTSSTARIQVFVRLTPDLDLRRFEDQLASAAARCEGVSFSTTPTWNALYRDPESQYLKDLCALTGQPSATAAYGTDGCVFRDVRRIAVCGPGLIDQAHTTDEYITLDALRAGVGLYRRLLGRFAG